MDRPDEPAPAGQDSRSQERYQCRPRTLVRLAVRPSFQSFPALAHDISAEGIGFLFNRPLEAGTVLALQLDGERPGISLIRMAQVIHSRRHLPVTDAPWIKKKPLFKSLLSFLTASPSAPRTADDFIWLIGCRLRPPLSPEELESLR
jgi:hypothetical protein